MLCRALSFLTSRTRARTIGGSVMKIESIIVSCVLLGTLAVAQETAPATPAAEPAASPQAQHQAFAKDIIGNVKEMTATLKGVTDTATADAAAPKAKELVALNKELMQASKNLPQLTPDAAAAQKALFAAQAKPAMADLRTELLRVLNNQCYNSDALLQALAPMIHG